MFDPSSRSGISSLNDLDCLIFQNHYTTELSMYEVFGGREKCIYRNLDMVKHPHYETDQQSHFAVYR